MIRIFLRGGELAGDRLVLTGAAARHVGGALRVRPGEALVAVGPDAIEHFCKVASVSPTRVEAIVERTAPSPREPTIRVRLGLSLLKGDQLERIVEYAAEMGASSIQPILAQRSVVRWTTDKLRQREQRWAAIAESGAALGQRGAVPAVLAASDLEAAVHIASSEAAMRRLLLYEGDDLPSLSNVDLAGSSGVALFVGPEGGWTEDEVEAARQQGAVAVTLGPRIMRPLPAALMALAVVLHRAGELEKSASGAH